MNILREAIPPHSQAIDLHFTPTNRGTEQTRYIPFAFLPRFQARAPVPPTSNKGRDGTQRVNRPRADAKNLTQYRVQGFRPSGAAASHLSNLDVFVYMSAVLPDPHSEVAVQSSTSFYTVTEKLASLDC